MTINCLFSAVSNTRHLIRNCMNGAGLRLTPTAFLRKRILSAMTVLTIILWRIYHSLQLELDDCFDGLGGGLEVSKQAFSKARQKLNPDYVRSFFDMTAEIAALEKSAETFKGMRLIAIDGSDAALENTPELKREFGCSGPKNNAATALISMAYDSLNQVVYDCRIVPYGTGERELAKLHVQRLKELGLKGNLLLFDRGYPSAEFITYLRKNGFHFIMRVRKKWNEFVDAVPKKGMFVVNHNGAQCLVRVIKVELDTGEIETLLTSLNMRRLSAVDAADLYHKRWPVETGYDKIKSKLELENFSGKTKVSVLQDFYATMYLANLVEFAAVPAEKRIIEKYKTQNATQADQATNSVTSTTPKTESATQELSNQESERVYVHKANRNRAVRKLRNLFFCVIAEPNDHKREQLLERLVSRIARRPVSIEQERRNPRKPPRKKRFHLARRSVV